MICHSCGAEIAEGVNFCTYCGAEQKPVELKICLRCNYANRIDDDNCKKCGSPLSARGKDFKPSHTGVPEEPGQPAAAQHHAPQIPSPHSNKHSAPVLPPFDVGASAPGNGMPGIHNQQKPPLQNQPVQPIPGVSPSFQVGQPQVAPVKPPLPSPSVQPPVKAGIPHPSASIGNIQVQPAPQQPQKPIAQPLNIPQAQVNTPSVARESSVQQKIPQQQVKPPLVPQQAAAQMNVPPTAPGINITPIEEVSVESNFDATPSFQPNAGAFLFCDVCGAKNESDLNECKYCQSPLKKVNIPAAPVKPQAPITGLQEKPQPPGPEMKPAPPQEVITGAKGKICKKCNTENPTMMVICYNCGESLEEEKPSFRAPSPAAHVQYTAPKPQPQPMPSNPQINLGTAPPAVPPSPDTAAAPQKGEVSKKICPKCGTPNLLGSTICGHCGFLFRVEGDFSDDTETKPFLVCPKCYFRNAVDATECSKCHTTLKILPNVKVKDQNGFPVIGESLIKCPVCGSENPREVLSCKHCNYNFLKKKQEVIKVAPPPVPEGDRIACPRCGSDNSKNDQRCKICGEKLNKQTTVEMPVYSQQKIAPVPPVPLPGNIPQPPISSVGANAAVKSQPQGFPAEMGGPMPPIAPKGSTAAPPPPIGIQSGGAIAEPKVQFVPDWKQGKKPAVNEPQKNGKAEKQDKPKGTFSKKTAMIIILSILAVIVVAIILMLLDSGGSSSSSPLSNLKSDQSEKGLSEEVISDSGSSETGISGKNVNIPSGSITGVDANKTNNTQPNNIALVEDNNTSEINDLISKSRDALKRGRVNYPRNNNAVYYFLQAREKGADSSDFEELKSQISASLHSLGDKKLGERSFKDANTFYDLAAQVDPDDTSIRRKKSQVREVQKRTEIEKNELDAAIRTQSIAELEKFVDKYPTSPYTTTAREEIVRLKKIKLDTEAREDQRRKDEAVRKAFEDKQYVFNVVHSYFMGRNRGKLIINRKGILFEPVDNKNERFYATYDQIESVVYDDGTLVIKFKQSMGDVGDDISLKHITESDPKTKQIFDAYDELHPK